MTTIALPYPSRVTLDSDMELNFRDISAKFGEGYRQVAPDGINAITEDWSIVIGPLTRTERNTALTAFKTVGTWGRITWTPCDETVQLTFQIKSGTGIKVSRVGRKFKLSLSLEQVF